MLSRLVAAALAVSFGAIAVQIAAAPPAARPNPRVAAVEHRQAEMKKMGGALKAVAGFAQGANDDVAQLRRSAQTIQTVAAGLDRLFQGAPESGSATAGQSPPSGPNETLSGVGSSGFEPLPPPSSRPQRRGRRQGPADVQGDRRLVQGLPRFLPGRALSSKADSQAARRRVLVWDLPTRLFHWILVASVAGCWWTGERGDMETHALLGYVVLALLLFRLAWGLVGSETARFTSFLRGPSAAIGHVRHFLSPGPLEGEAGHNPVGG